MCYIGDGNNMANSLIVGGLKVGMKVSVACPEGYQPGRRGAGLRREATATVCQLTDDADGGRGRTPTSSSPTSGPPWARRARRQSAKPPLPGYQVNDAAAWPRPSPTRMVQHCLPAHRGEEITEEVFEAHAQ